MKPNPYETPQASSGRSDKTLAIALRAIAIVLWVLAPIPAIAILVPMLVFETAESRRELPFKVYLFAVVQFILPSVGLALFGAACWWRIRWLGFVGLYAFVPLGFLLALALLRS